MLFASDHDQDGSLKHGAVIVELGGPFNTQTDNLPRRQILTFDVVSLGFEFNISEFPNDFIAPLVNHGAPYNGINMSKFTLFKPFSSCTEWKP